jgi:hypothetical protein
MTMTIPPTADAPSGYTVRRLLPDDAAGVTACVCRIYGDSYFHREVYEPERLVALNATDQLVSVVALDGGGRIIGHYALERGVYPDIAEEGEAMVMPEHRHHHLMEAMRGLLEQEARRLNLLGLFGDAVTNHVFTQKLHERFGLAPCAVELGALPRSFHNMPEPMPQRMSLLVAFKYLRPPMAAPVYAPGRHRAICARIYEGLGGQADFRDGGPAPPQGGLAVEVNPAIQAATIRVERVGQDTAAEIIRARERCAEAEAILLELPLAQPGAAAACEAAERAGFFFSGIGPSFAADGDTLRLQLLKVPLDVALVQIDAPFARELVAYVARERERVAHGA